MLFIRNAFLLLLSSIAGFAIAFGIIFFIANNIIEPISPGRGIFAYGEILSNILPMFFSILLGIVGYMVALFSVKEILNKQAVQANDLKLKGFNDRASKLLIILLCSIPCLLLLRYYIIVMGGYLK